MNNITKLVVQWIFVIPFSVVTYYILNVVLGVVDAVRLAFEGNEEKKQEVTVDLIKGIKLDVNKLIHYQEPYYLVYIAVGIIFVYLLIIKPLIEAYKSVRLDRSPKKATYKGIGKKEGTKVETKEFDARPKKLASEILKEETAKEKGRVKKAEVVEESKAVNIKEEPIKKVKKIFGKQKEEQEKVKAQEIEVEYEEKESEIGQSTSSGNEVSGIKRGNIESEISGIDEDEFKSFTFGRTSSVLNNNVPSQKKANKVKAEVAKKVGKPSEAKKEVIKKEKETRPTRQTPTRQTPTRQTPTRQTPTRPSKPKPIVPKVLDTDITISDEEIENGRYQFKRVDKR